MVAPEGQKNGSQTPLLMAIAEFLRDPPTWDAIVLIVAGSLIGLYVVGRIGAWWAGQATPESE